MRVSLTITTTLEGPVDVSTSQIERAFAGGAYDDAQVREFARSLVRWSGVFGFRTLLIASQIGHETAWFRFGNLVKPDQLNFAGLGSTGPGFPGHSFPTIDAGVLAVVAHHAVYHWGPKANWPQHLQQYASADPRYSAVLSAHPGVRTEILGDYRGTWAVPGTTYPENIVAASKRITQYPREEPTMSGRDDRFAWVPDTSEYGYPQGTRGRNGFNIDLGIVHITVGNDSLGWLNGNNGSSAHLLTDKAMRPRAQMVSFNDAAWTAGSRDYNLRGINVEAEMPGNQWTKALITTFAETTLPVWKAYNIPLVYLGRDNGAGKRGLIGHADVPDPDGSGWGGAGNHTDPGSTFDWPFYIAELKRLDAAQPSPVPDKLILPGQGSESPDVYPPGAGMVLGFKGTYLALGAAKSPADPAMGVLTLTGWATEDEWEGVDGCVYQRFQRVTLQYNPSSAAPWDIVQMLPDTPLPERKPVS